MCGVYIVYSLHCWQHWGTNIKWSQAWSLCEKVRMGKWEKPLISEVLMGLLWAASQMTKTRSHYLKEMWALWILQSFVRGVILFVLTAPTFWLIVTRAKAAHLTKQGILQCYHRHDATWLNSQTECEREWLLCFWESKANNRRQKKIDTE